MAKFTINAATKGPSTSDLAAFLIMSVIFSWGYVAGMLHLFEEVDFHIAREAELIWVVVAFSIMINIVFKYNEARKMSAIPVEDQRLHFATSIAPLFRLMGVSVILFSLGLLWWQVLNWLQHGTWVRLDLLSIIAGQERDAEGLGAAFQSWYSPSIDGWLHNDESWIGLKTILAWLARWAPAPLLLLLFGLLIASVLLNAADVCNENRRKQYDFEVKR